MQKGSSSYEADIYRPSSVNSNNSLKAVPPRLTCFWKTKRGPQQNPEAGGFPHEWIRLRIILPGPLNS